MLQRSAAFFALTILATLLFTGCDDAPPYNGPGLPVGYKKYEREKPPQVQIETAAGTIKAELLEDDAPLAVDNFVELAEKGFFNGKAFFRIDKDYMVCAGDPQGNEADGKRYHFKNEFTKDKNKHVQYALSIDNSFSTAQFCIVTNPKGLDWKNSQNTVFGKVTEGKEIVDKLNNWTVKGQNPEPPIPITAVTFSYKRNRQYKLDESEKELEKPDPNQQGGPSVRTPSSFQVPQGTHSNQDLQRMIEEAQRKAQQPPALPPANQPKPPEPVKPPDTKPEPARQPNAVKPPQPVKPAEPAKPADAKPAETKKEPEKSNPAPK
jgi:cyclophilin family peptidyl-prolyl cis-trans isomerase